MLDVGTNEQEWADTMTVVAGNKEELAQAIWTNARWHLRENGQLPDRFIDDLVLLGGEVMTLVAVTAAANAKQKVWDRDDHRPGDALMAVRQCLADPTDESRLTCLRIAASARRAASKVKSLRGTPQQPAGISRLISAAVACQQAAKTASWALGDDPHFAREALRACLYHADMALGTFVAPLPS